MNPKSTQNLGFVCLFLFAFAATVSRAAPIRPEAREKESTHIVTGRIISVNSIVQKSQVEEGAGNKDEIFTFIVEVTSTTKGEGIKVGDEIKVDAWKSKTRIGAASIRQPLR